MFTGIVEGIGRILTVVERPGSHRLEIVAPAGLFDDVKDGDSIAVAGVCLTVVQHGPETIGVDVVPETLRRTRLGALTPGDGVNLERALRLGDRLGGHLVLGHVDDVCLVRDRRTEGDGHWLVVQAPVALARFLPEKAFVTLDGVSLTVAAGADAAGLFAVALIPETLRRTTLGQAREGAPLDLEIDPLARYVDRLLLARADLPLADPAVAKEIRA